MLKKFKIDLHNHTVLSPCGGLEMSPLAFIERAKELGLDMIAVTDHNSCKNCQAYYELGKKHDIVVIPGVEIQTMEEIHVVALFPDIETAMKFDEEIYEALLPIENNPDYFGDQVIVDKDENIIGIEERALINSVIWDFETTVLKVKEFDSICFPAHIDAQTNSVISQLGFLPKNLSIDGVGITARCDINQFMAKNSYLSGLTVIRNSDAHYLNDMGSGSCFARLAQASFQELKKAFAKEEGREIIPA
ncbi:PHP domain-containing protein [bacterium]|nr:PHP domain-containing protein [bacterium]